MRRTSAVVLCFLLLGLATGCGSSSSSSSGANPPAAGSSGSTSTPEVHFAKTKFVLHAGLAFGAFHRYIYKPVKQGTFRAAGGGRKAVILLKAGLAAAFVYHELKLAATDVRASPALSKLFSPLTSLADRVRGLTPGLRSGTASAASVEQANTQVGSLQSQSKSAGTPTPDVTPPANLVATQ